MGSYLPLKFGGTLYPVKVGGFTGKDEPKIALTQHQLAKLKRAVKNNDTVVLRELDQVVDKTAVQDIRNAYMAWIPRAVVKATGLTTDIKKLTFVLPSKTIIVPVKSASKWLTSKTKGRAKPIAVWFGDPDGEKLHPFKPLMNAQLRAGLYDGLKLLDQFTLKREPKKSGTITYYRKAKNANAEMKGMGLIEASEAIEFGGKPRPRPHVDFSPIPGKQKRAKNAAKPSVAEVNTILHYARSHGDMAANKKFGKSKVQFARFVEWQTVYPNASKKSQTGMKKIIADLDTRGYMYTVSRYGTKQTDSAIKMVKQILDDFDMHGISYTLNKWGETADHAAAIKNDEYAGRKLIHETGDFSNDAKITYYRKAHNNAKQSHLVPFTRTPSLRHVAYKKYWVIQFKDPNPKEFLIYESKGNLQELIGHAPTMAKAKAKIDDLAKQLYSSVPMSQAMREQMLNHAMIMGAQINPLKRWIVAEVTPDSKKKLAGTFSTPEEATEAAKLYEGKPNIKVMQWGMFQRIKTGKANEAEGPSWKQVNETPNEYSMMQHLLNALPKPSEGLEARTRWIADFNALAQEIEEEIKNDQTGALDQISLPPWFARMEKDNEIWLYSPPFVRKAKGTTFEAVRLVVNADAPLKPNGTDVAARSVPLDDKFNPAGLTQYWCWLQNTNPEEIKGHALVAIWYLWDSIARVGIDKGLETGFIKQSWVDNVFEHAQACHGKYPLAYYKRGRATNEYLMTLYRLCAARGITEADLHGRGGGVKEFTGSGKSRGTPYTNTWIDEQGVCAACDFTQAKPLSYGTKNYPYGSILGHVLSVRHRRNAAEYLLRQQQQQGLKVDVANASLAPVKGSKRVTRQITPRDTTVFGRSGEINLPYPERRTGRKKPQAKKRISPKTRAITTRVEAHKGKSRTGKETNVKAHPRQTGKAKKFKTI